ncbi:MAG: hypothetical protein IIB07_02985 [Bacteroidetes bacterium]|nr:hypothetical protein [Bacteroidota bacterium]
MKKLKVGKWVVIGVIVLLASIVGIFHDGLLINNKATDIMVIQYTFTGTLKFQFSAGAKWRFWGEVQRYPKSFQFWFDSTHVTGMGPIKTRFIGGVGTIIGGVRITYPLIEETEITIVTNNNTYELTTYFDEIKGKQRAGINVWQQTCGKKTYKKFR